MRGFEGLEFSIEVDNQRDVAEIAGKLEVFSCGDEVEAVFYSEDGAQGLLEGRYENNRKCFVLSSIEASELGRGIGTYLFSRLAEDLNWVEVRCGFADSNQYVFENEVNAGCSFEEALEKVPMVKIMSACGFVYFHCEILDTGLVVLSAYK